MYPMRFFLFDQKAEKFVRYKALDELTSPEIKSDEKRIYSLLA